MRRTIGLLALGALAAGTLVIGGTPAGAQATTQVWAVHGLNLNSQDAPGGTAVTVCAGGAAIDDDFQFGEVIGPLPLNTGVAVNIEVYVGDGVDCAAPVNTPLIDQDVTPTGAAVALVATSQGEQLQPELVDIPLDIDCTPAGQGRVTAAHTANAPEVDVIATIASTDVVVDTIAYGDSITAELPVGTYPVRVELAGTDTVVAGPIDVAATEGGYLAAFVVGNQPGREGTTPVVVITEVNDVGVCEEPTTTTTTTTVKPTSTTAKAAAATATPRYTG